MDGVKRDIKIKHTKVLSILSSRLASSLETLEAEIKQIDCPVRVEVGWVSYKNTLERANDNAKELDDYVAYWNEKLHKG